MPSSSTASLARECEVFTRYLTGRAPDASLHDRYRQGHGALPAARAATADRFDRTLLWLARRHPALTGLADSYARMARPRGILRQKLILLLALVEHLGAYADTVEPALTTGPLRAWMAVAGHGAVWSIRLILAGLLLGPLHLFLRGGGAKHA